MNRTWLSITILGMSLAAHAGASNAAEIKFLSPTAMRAVIVDVVAQFERTSGHKVVVEYATVGVISDRLLKDEYADVTAVSGPLIENLLRQGKIVAGSRVDVAQVGVGMFVRAGAAKPDIRTVDAFKRALQAARTISYGDPAAGGVSGVHMAALVGRLGIAEDMKPKTRMLANSQAVLGAVAKGEVEIGIGLTSDTVLVSGVDLAGAFPAELQNFTLYAAGVVSASKQADAARDFIKFMASPAGHTALRAKGFEPR